MDTIKLGYGARFASAFAAAGYDDADDLRVCAPDAASLASMLRVAGAAAPQQQRIFAAVVELIGRPLPETVALLGAQAPSHAAAASSARNALGSPSVVAAGGTGGGDSGGESAAAVSTPASSFSRPVAEQSSSRITPHKYVTDGQTAAASANAVASTSIVSSVHSGDGTAKGNTAANNDGDHKVDSNGNASRGGSAVVASAPQHVRSWQPAPTESSIGRRSSSSTTLNSNRSSSASSIIINGNGNGNGTNTGSIKRKPSASSSSSSLATGTLRLHKIFRCKSHAMLSYQWDCQDQVKAIRATLEDRGLHCWMDIDNFSTDIYDSMAEGVQGAFCILACMSQQYQDSANCKLELKFAQQSGIPIVPLMMVPGWKATGWLGIITVSMHTFRMLMCFLRCMASRENIGWKWYLGFWGVVVIDRGWCGRRGV